MIQSIFADFSNNFFLFLFLCVLNLMFVFLAEVLLYPSGK